MISSLTQLIKEKNLYDKAIISSFDPRVPYMIKKVDNNILTRIRSFLLPLFLGVDMLLLHYKNINGYAVCLPEAFKDQSGNSIICSYLVPFLTDYPQNLSDIKESTPA
ncbi:hypothetical protein ANCDUO_01860 [Ancylostoma duodenale]|uniref:Uncharacterized protein n=1 Tax=Ancylostoma duodenale TaxID=51022 RepID=A0A0C2H224_9BILA|nr:hypothetical protein ANCDUO_01860 [Ancylostoma duodenale]